MTKDKILKLNFVGPSDNEVSVTGNKITIKTPLGLAIEQIEKQARWANNQAQGAVQSLGDLSGLQSEFETIANIFPEVRQYLKEQQSEQVEQRTSGLVVIVRDNLTRAKTTIGELSYQEKRELYKQLQSELGGKTKPGPVPMTDEEKCALVEHFKKCGLSQTAYADLYGLSRYGVQQSLAWYRANVGIA